jgi:hypothetical protein
MSVHVNRSKNGKVITLESDKFEYAAQAIYDSFGQERVATGGKYRAFNSDSALYGYSQKEIPRVMDMNAKLAMANVTMGIRLWREGLQECNNYIKTTHFEQGTKVTIKLPKILDGELTLDEGGEVVGGHASGNKIQLWESEREPEGVSLTDAVVAYEQEQA